MKKHYKWNYPGRFENDVAITQAAGGEVMSIDWVVSTPVCLPHPDVCFSSGMTCVVTGWGLTEERGKLADTLQVVGVKLMERSQCIQYAGYSEIAETMLCAGFEKGEHDACSGDSGGPLVCRMSEGSAKGAWVLHGIVSWGYGCARPNSPGIYTDVVQYLDWIKENTGSNADFDYMDPQYNPDAEADGLTYDELLNENVSGCNADMLDLTESEEAQLFPIPAEIELEEVQIENTQGVCNYAKLSNGMKSFANNKASGEIHNQDGEIIPRSEHDNIALGIQFERIEIIESTDCLWVWQNDNPDYYIEMTISAYLQENCEQMAEADRLALEIEFENAGQQREQITICDSHRPITIKSKSFIKIQFKTRHRQFDNFHKMGFQLSWNFQNDLFHCNGPDNFSFDGIGETVTIESPNFPRHYDSQQECRWTIHSETDLVINFPIFQTERSNRHCNNHNDNLIIYYADNCNTETLRQHDKRTIHSILCGTQNRNSITIKKSDGPNPNGTMNLCICFKGDQDKKHGKGFKGEIKSVSASSSTSSKKNNKKRGGKNKKNRGKKRGKGRK